MTNTWKKLAFSAAILFIASFVVSTASRGQEPTAKLNELLPKMAAENMADEGQVRDMESAQLGWMNYCLQDCNKSKELRAESIKATCDALNSDAPVVAKAWLLHVLQWVGDDSCVDTVAKFLKNDDARLVDAAARVLAQIPTEKALNALKTDADKFASYIKARNVDISVPTETEIPLALPYLPEAKFDDYVSKQFGSLSNDDKARVLGAIRVRYAKKFLPLAVESVSSDNDDVKRAALLAIEKIGSGEQFDLLYKQTAEFDRGFCVQIMKNIVGDDFSAKVVDALKKEKDGANMASLAEVVGDRYIQSEVATLLSLAKKDDCPARLALLSAAERLATKDNIGDFVDAALNISDRGDRDRAEQIISRLCEGDASPVIAMINNQNGPQIFPLVGRIGGDAAARQVNRALESNDPNMKVYGVRAACNWPDATLNEKLLAVVKDSAYPENLRISALRAYIRVMSLPDEQDGIDLSLDAKLEALKNAFKLATRDDERRLVLERVGSVRVPGSVEFALQYVDEKELSNSAINAILDLAHQDYLRKENKELFLKALDVVIAKGNQQQKERAEGYKSNIR